MHTPILEEVVLQLPVLHLARRGTNSRTSPISANDNMAEHRGEYNSFLWPSPTSARGCRFGRSLPIFVLGYPVSTHETAEPPPLSSDGQEPSVGFLSRDTSLPLGKQSLGVPHPLPARLQSLPASGWPWDTAVASRAEPCRAEPCRTAPSVGAAAENFTGSFRAVRAHPHGADAQRFSSANARNATRLCRLRDGRAAGSTRCGIAPRAVEASRTPVRRALHGSGTDPRAPTWGRGRGRALPDRTGRGWGGKRSPGSVEGLVRPLPLHPSGMVERVAIMPRHSGCPARPALISGPRTPLISPCAQRKGNKTQHVSAAPAHKAPGLGLSGGQSGPSISAPGPLCPSPPCHTFCSRIQ